MQTTNQLIREFEKVLGPVELIDWSERYPRENSRTIAIRQSTYCCCGASDCRKQKQIGVMTCKG